MNIIKLFLLMTMFLSFSSLAVDEIPMEDETIARFESTLNLILAANQDLFPIVDDISKKIINIIDTRKEDIKNLLSMGDNFKNLYGALYLQGENGPLGSLYNENGSKNIDDILDDIKTTLFKENRTLVSIMSIHAAFGYYLFRLLEPEKYQNMRSSFKEGQKLIDIKKNKIKTTKDEEIPTIEELGILPLSSRYITSLNQEMALEIEKIKNSIHTCFHRNSLQRYEILEDLKNKFSFHLIAGPSSHIMTALTAAKLYGDFFDDELKEYALAYCAYLVTAGYHTFHEVMMMAAKCLNKRI